MLVGEGAKRAGILSSFGAVGPIQASGCKELASAAASAAVGEAVRPGWVCMYGPGLCQGRAGELVGVGVGELNLCVGCSVVLGLPKDGQESKVGPRLHLRDEYAERCQAARGCGGVQRHPLNGRAGHGAAIGG